MITVTASTSFEVEVELSGTFLPGCPEQGPTYASGGQPAEPDSMEDVEVRSLVATRYRGGYTPVSADLLAGVSAISPEALLKILANIREFLGDAADDALMTDLPEEGDDQ